MGDQEDLRAALGKTVPASHFDAQAMRDVAAQTAPDQPPDPTAGRYLQRTASDPASATGPDETVGSFGDSSVVPAELGAGPQPAGPRFRILAKVGSGATSQVYAVHDTSLDRTIAAKFLKASRGGNEGARQRFLHEARVTARLEHPNIMPIHDIGVDSNARVFFTMKNVEGVTVGDAIRAEVDGRPLPEGCRDLGDKLSIMHKVCDAVAFAHANGYVHQDIKPDNIMLGRYGEVLLLDWGCALRRDMAAGAAGAAIYGTPAYMSPEQARRETVDERSDIYCLGATLYHMLTLCYPTWSDDAERFWELKRRGELTPLPAEAEGRAPAALLAVCRKAMAPEPAGRYQSAGELRDALRQYLVHAESIQLTEEAGRHLAALGPDSAYDAFAEVTHDLRQALRMWPENAEAQQLGQEAARAHAAAALKRGDLWLAESLVGDNPAFADLRERIAAALAEAAARRRRGRVLRLMAAALAVAVAGFLAYFAVDYFRHFGSWKTVYHWNPSLGKPAGLSRSVMFDRPLETSADSVALKGAAIDAAHYHTFLLDGVRVSGDVRVEALVMWPARIDGFEVHIQARREMPPLWWMCMPGFACQFGGNRGRDNLISRNETGRAPEGGNTVAATFAPRRWYRLAFEHRGEEVAMYVDGRKVHSQKELLPLPGEGFERVAFRAWADMRVRSLTVRRMALPRKASPLVVGDAAVVRRDFADAVQQYVRIAEDFGDDPIAERALARACLVAPLTGPSRDSISAAVRAMFSRRFPVSRYWAVIRQVDCIAAWAAGRYDEALGMVDSVFAHDPETRLAMRLLSQSDGRVLPDDITDRLLRAVGNTTRVRGLVLANRGIRSLEPLAGMRLSFLNIQDNCISSLEPLAGMPLQELNAGLNNVRDLSPLAGMPLAALTLQGNAVSDLSPLRGTPLVEIDMGRNPIEDLSPLRGTRLTSLAIPYCRVSSLEPLRGMPLATLDIEGNPVVSIEPLAGMRLTGLDMEWTQVRDISALRGMPLDGLGMSGSPVTDLSPLAACTTLRALDAFYTPVADLSPLRGLRKLEALNIKGTRVTELTPLAGLPLRELKLDSLPLPSLAPLAGIGLEVLSMAWTGTRELPVLDMRRLRECNLRGNRVSDLRPLHGLRLDVLDIRYTPVRDLTPLDHAPRSFNFSWGAVPAAELAAIARRWRAAGSGDPALQLELRAAVEEGRYADARRLALPFEGRRYLPVNRPGTYREADSICSRLGAHLVTVTSLPEYQFVSGLLWSHGMQSWLGLERKARPERWVTGESVTFRMFVEPSTPAETFEWFQMVGSGSGWFHNGTYAVMAGFVAEWDE